MVKKLKESITPYEQEHKIHPLQFPTLTRGIQKVDQQQLRIYHSSLRREKKRDPHCKIPIQLDED